MSADLKRVRAKQDEGYSSPVSKKRALAGGAGPSGVGGGQAEEEDGGMEDWMKVVEVSGGCYYSASDTRQSCKAYWRVERNTNGECAF
jgi:hypothetical protein